MYSRDRLLPRITSGRDYGVDEGPQAQQVQKRFRLVRVLVFCSCSSLRDIAGLEANRMSEERLIHLAKDPF